jgi:hypothetical protein
VEGRYDPIKALHMERSGGTYYKTWLRADTIMPKRISGKILLNR